MSKWVERRRLFSQHEAGCYAIYVDGKLVYIGMTDQMSNRLRASLATAQRRYRELRGRRGGWWTVKCRPERFYGERATLELRLIRRLRPVLNSVGKRGRTAA